MCVPQCHFHVAMPEQFLDSEQVHASQRQVRREAVPRRILLKAPSEPHIGILVSKFRIGCTQGLLRKQRRQRPEGGMTVTMRKPVTASMGSDLAATFILGACSIVAIVALDWWSRTFGNNRHLELGEVRGHRGHRIYHRDGCKYGDVIRRPVIFESRAVAEGRSYRACWVCCP